MHSLATLFYASPCYTNISSAMTWQQFSAFRYVSMVKMTRWSSNWTSKWARKVISVSLSVAWLLVPGVLALLFQNSRAYFPRLGVSPHKIPAWITQNGQKKIKYPVNGSSLGEKASLMPDVRGELPGCLKLIGIALVTTTQAEELLWIHNTSNLDSDGSSSSRSHPVAFLSANNTQAYQN